jgi:hypothetical protein
MGPRSTFGPKILRQPLRFESGLIIGLKDLQSSSADITMNSRAILLFRRCFYKSPPEVIARAQAIVATNLMGRAPLFLNLTP